MHIFVKIYHFDGYFQLFLTTNSKIIQKMHSFDEHLDHITRTLVQSCLLIILMFSLTTEMLDVKHKVIWHVNDATSGTSNSNTSRGDGLVIPFENVPFIFAGKKVYECRHGSDKGTLAKMRWKKIAEERLVRWVSR